MYLLIINYYLIIFYIIFIISPSSSPDFNGVRHAIGILHVYCRRPIGY
jgi:hypothetical protein